MYTDGRGSCGSWAVISALIWRVEEGGWCQVWLHPPSSSMHFSGEASL